MHTAYKVKQLLKLPLAIESIKAIGDHLLVGTRQGHLLMYSVSFDGLSDSSDNSSAHVQLFRSNKNFSKKAIVQLEAVSEYNILVALSDYSITVHDIDLSVTNFPVITTLPRTKGATAFALDVLRQKTLTGEQACTVRLAVAVKRKLQLYYWKNRKFMELQQDISLPDVPKSLAWCNDSIVVGLRSEYRLLKLGAPHREVSMQELFPTGKSQDPSVIRMADDRFALVKDDQTTFVNRDGELALEALTWSELPLAVTHDPPYLIAALPNSVEIKCEAPKLSVQSIELPKPFLTGTIHNRPGIVYIASTSHIWCLTMVPVSVQIPQLLKVKTICPIVS